MTEFTSIVRGSFVGLNTPMNGDFSIDDPGFATLLDFQREAGMPAGPRHRPLSDLDGQALARGLEIVRTLGLETAYGYRTEPVLAAE